MKNLFAIALITLMTVVSASVQAAPAEVPQTGQTLCYDATGGSVTCAGTGQDGDLLSGLAWPDPRFTDNGDGTVTDNLTGLMWLEDANCLSTNYPGVDADGLVYWQEALVFIIGIDGGATYPLCGAGYTDWRLPNVNELKSLVDFNENTKALPASHPFDNVENPYWSSTTHANDLTNAYGVTMDNGSILSVPKLGGAFAAIWPVRDSGNAGRISLPQTRQATCYDDGGNPISCAGTGQDAEFQNGVTWPVPRFTDNGDGTVTDELTGLTWLGDAEDCMGGIQSWANALDTVADLNANPANYHAIVTCDYTGTHDDWRLANIRELESIAHYAFTEEGAYNSTSEWLDDLGVGFNTVPSLYWASTTDTGSTGNANTYTIAALGVSGSYDKDGASYRAWPVRGGLYGDPDISVSPTAVDFGTVTVGQSTTQDITVTNDGTQYLEVDATAALTAPFSIANDGCANQMITPGGTCAITVSYDPTSEGTDSGTANVTSDDPDEATVAVALAGTGTSSATTATNNPPAAFDLVFPSDGATITGTTVTMIWKATTDPDGGTLNYDITYCEDETFVTCTALENIAVLSGESRWMKFAKNWIKSLVTGPLSLMGCGGGSTSPTDNNTTPSVNADELSYTAMDLNPGTTYYWKVTANDADGGATESEARSFSTE